MDEPFKYGLVASYERSGKLSRIRKVLEEAEELGRTALNEVQRSLMYCMKVTVKFT
jgi:hypothetical protein